MTKIPGDTAGRAATMLSSGGETFALAALREMIVTLQDHIDHRAAEIAAPRIQAVQAEADRKLATAVREQGWAVQRLDDLRTEMRRQFEVVERQAARDRQRVARVRELHKRVVHKSGTSYCNECCDGVIHPWPCDTIRALDEEADRV